MPNFLSHTHFIQVQNQTQKYFPGGVQQYLLLFNVYRQFCLKKQKIVYAEVTTYS